MALLRAVAVAALNASLLDAADVFGEPGAAERTAAFNRHLDEAVRDFDRVLPQVVDDALALVSDVRNYVAHPLARSFVDAPLIYENSQRDLDDPYRVDQVPTPMLRMVDGIKTWAFMPKPTASILFRIGTDYRFSYRRAHQLSDDADSSIQDEDAPLLIQRAQIAALKELAIRNAHKPVSLRDTQYSQTRNGTPAGLADVMMGMWEQQAREASGRYGSFQAGGA